MNFEQKLLEILGKIEGLAKPAADVAMQAAQVEAISNLASGLVWALLLIPIGWALRRLWAMELDSHNDIFVYMARGICCLVGFIVTANALEALLDVWNWVGIFNPQLFLAHQIIERAL